jgi:hypothetical protein
MAVAQCYRFFGRGIIDFTELMKGQNVQSNGAEQVPPSRSCFDGVFLLFCPLGAGARKIGSGKPLSGARFGSHTVRIWLPSGRKRARSP